MIPSGPVAIKLTDSRVILFVAQTRLKTLPENEFSNSIALKLEPIEIILAKANAVTEPIDHRFISKRFKYQAYL